MADVNLNGDINFNADNIHFHFHLPADGVSGVIRHLSFADMLGLRPTDDAQTGIDVKVAGGYGFPAPPETADSEQTAAATDEQSVGFPLTYAAIGSLEAGDYVQWDGAKLQFTGTLEEDAYESFDADQDKDVTVVRVRRGDTGKVVKLNLAADHKGTLTLLS